MKELPTHVREIAFESIVLLLKVPWKRGEVHIKELLFLNLSSNFDALKWKLSVCTLIQYSLYNCNLNMFWSAAKIIQIVPLSKYIWT